MKIAKQFHTSLERGLSKAIFDHVRNYLMCAFLMATGTYAMEQKAGWPADIGLTEFIGVGIVAVGFILALLNLYDGIYRLSKFKHHLILDVVLVLLYVILSERIIEISWGFRVSH